jgi:hypothetical protein
VRKPLVSLGALVFLATCLVFLFTVTSSSHEEEFRARRVAILTDWTTNHVLYPLYGRVDRMELAQRDPRAMFSWMRYGPNAPHPRLPRPPFRSSRGFARDWSINLGTAGTAANMYPAKFTFDITALPSCADDYIVYPVNAAGSTSQANLVAFNNLYSGTGAGGTGSCNRTPTTDDDGVDATVLWSYNVSAIGGAVTTSPVLSWDVAGASPSVLGTKVAFVESTPGSPAHFHVLAWKAGDGQDTTDADGLQNTLTPAQITSFVTTDPVAGSGTATDLALLTSDTLSAPYVDYTHDYAYVGDDEGNLYRIKDVFCPSYNTDTGCTAGVAPSLDASWGTAGVVEVGGQCGALTGAVDDSVTGNVFVGCSDGRIYGFTSTGAKLSSAYLVLGDSTSFGGVVVPPIVDSSNGLVYAVTGTDGTSPVLLQANTALGAAKKVALGTAPENAGNAGENITVPTFNTAYFSSATSSNWAILSCGYDSTGFYTVLYDVGFNASRVMNIAAPPSSNQFELASNVEACSPLTGFTNASTSTDWLFVGLSGGPLSNYDITSTTGSGFPGGFASTATYSVSGGSSGIIPDNESTAVQASSIYFTGLAAQTCGVGGMGYCAIKLTQAGLD